MIGVLANLDDYGGWIAGVVAGLVAIGWLARRVARAIRATWHRAKEIGRKIDTLEELAGYELNSNGGGSIKDRVAKIPELERRSESHDRNLRGIRAEQSAARDRLGALEQAVASLTPAATSVVVTSDTTTVTTEVPSS